MSDELNNDEFITNTYKLAIKMASAMRTKDKELLQLVTFKKGGHGFYYSLTDKTPIYINRKEEWYYVPFIEKDDRDRICLYSHFLFSMAIFIMVPEEEIDFIGFN